MKSPLVSIIILNHNARDFLSATLDSIASQQGIKTEVIVVDNDSTDGSAAMVKKDYPAVKWVQRDTSVGFSAGNNVGIKHASGDTILFLNPDASFTQSSDLKMCYDKLWGTKGLGALTARVNLVASGGIDETCHRGFPTPWAGLTHFSGLSKLFPKLPIFNQYTKRYLGYETEHEIDAIGGMFFLIKREVGERVGWWDEDYPFYGDDLDFCYRLKQAGFSNYYYPGVTVMHYKGISSGMGRHTKQISTANIATRQQARMWSIQAMEIFYRKHYASKYPVLLNWLVYLGIKLLRFRRLTLA